MRASPVCRERFRSAYVVIWRPDQIFKKSDLGRSLAREIALCFVRLFSFNFG